MAVALRRIAEGMDLFDFMEAVNPVALRTRERLEFREAIRLAYEYLDGAFVGLSPVKEVHALQAATEAYLERRESQIAKGGGSRLDRMQFRLSFGRSDDRRHLVAARSKSRDYFNDIDAIDPPVWEPFAPDETESPDKGAERTLAWDQATRVMDVFDRMPTSTLFNEEECWSMWSVAERHLSQEQWDVLAQEVPSVESRATRLATRMVLAEFSRMGLGKPPFYIAPDSLLPLSESLSVSLPCHTLDDLYTLGVTVSPPHTVTSWRAMAGAVAVDAWYLSDRTTRESHVL